LCGYDQDFQYICENCENKEFIEAHYLRKHTEAFLTKFGIIEENNKDIHINFSKYIQYVDYDRSEYVIDELNSQIELEYKIIELEDRIVSCYQTKQDIPEKINFAFNSVESSPVQLYTLTLFKNGDLLEDYNCFYDNGQFSKLKNQLNVYLRHKESVLGHLVPKVKNITTKSAQFFLANTHLKEYGFYLWDDTKQLPKSVSKVEEGLLFLLQNRKEKSIKKAIFQNYQNQIQTHNHFKTVLINVVLACIEDVNFICELLNRNLYTKYINISEELFVKQFIFFLKKYYEQKQIVRFIKEIADEQSYFLDTLREFIYLQHNLDEIFQKPKCTVIGLHDELVRCSSEKYRELQYSIMISYLHNQEDAQSSVLDYEVKLPYSGHDLYTWADELHNCLNGYLDLICENKSTVYGFFKNNKISFAVEITENEIRQASGKYNQALDKEQTKALQEWYKRFFKKHDFVKSKKIN
jgi:hypothetical protein